MFLKQNLALISILTGSVWLGLVSIPVSAASPTFDDSLSAQLVALVNNYRESQGRPKLEVNSKLNAVAKARVSAIYSAQTLISSSDHTHTIPGFGGFATHSVSLGLASNSAVENFTATTSGIQGALNNWIKSQGHRTNMLDDQFVLTGLAVATNLKDVGDPQIPSNIGEGIVAIQVFSTGQGLVTTSSSAPTPQTQAQTQPNSTISTNSSPGVTTPKTTTTTQPKPKASTAPTPTPKPSIDLNQKVSRRIKFDSITLKKENQFGASS